MPGIVPPFTCLIVPVPAAESLVRATARQFDPTSPMATLPSELVAAHVTVLAPFLPVERIDQQVVDQLRSVCASQQRHAFDLAETATFPGGVVYLRPDPPEPLLALMHAVFQHWPETPPYGGQFSSVVPHVTLAVVGNEPERISRVTEFARLFLPLHGEASEVQLMLVHDGRWDVLNRFDLYAD